LYARGANPVAEGAAVRSAALMARGLPADPPLAGHVALGAVLGGWAVGTTGFAIHHALCQTIVREADTSHAETNAVMLPHTVAFMAGRAPREIAALAEAMGAADDPAAASGAVAHLAALAGARTLGELGFDKSEIPAIAAAAAAHPAMGATPGGVGQQDLEELLRAAL